MSRYDFLSWGLPCAVLVVFSAMFAFAPAAFAGEAYGLKLKQTAPSVGPVTIYLTPTALRVNRGDIVTLARAPKWQVYWYNSKKKIFLTEPYEKALKATLLIETTSTAILDVNSPWKKGAEEVIAGLPATMLTNHPSGKLTSNSVRNVRYWHYVDKQLPRQGGEWLATCYAVPYLGGIPLRCKYLGTNSSLLPISRSTDNSFGEQFWLDTVEAHKEAMPDSLFVMPKGYKEVRNITDLYLAQPLTKENPLIKDLLKNPAALFGSQ